MMKRTLAKLSLSAALSVGTIFSASAAPVTYVIDDAHTAARFTYDHLGLSTQLGKFRKTSGTVVLDLESRTGAVDVVIDTTSVETGDTEFNSHIQGTDFLDTANHPTASFKSTKFNFDGDKLVSVEGNLTIKGVTKPVTFQIERFAAKDHPMLKKPVVGADATAVIKRSEFNAGKFAPAVSDDVTLSIAIEAVQQ